MKTKLYWAGLVIAAALMCTSCTNKNRTATVSTVDEEVFVIHDDKNLINGDLWRASEIRQIYGSAGQLCEDYDFGHNYIDQYRALFVKQDGGFAVGYVVITHRGITLQSDKSFYFYNRHCLKKLPEVFNISGMVLNDGTLIPVKIQVNGADDKFMKDCKDTDVIGFVPLRLNEDTILFSVKDMKDYCTKNNLPSKAVPYLKFND